MSPEIYSVLSVASRWLFAFFALMLLYFAFSWHRSMRKDRKDRLKNLPGAGTVGELVVLSGSSQLLPDTWFPVPREGILGSLRSCDLVIPCEGVRSQHLDFSWQDGTGLLIRPRAGCEALVDGVPVSRRGSGTDAPLLHGSVLQVGSAVLRLQLFSALSHTNRTFIPPAPASQPGEASWQMPGPPAQFPSAAAQPRPSASFGPCPPYPEQPVYPYPPEPPVRPLPQEQPLPGQMTEEQAPSVPEQAAPEPVRNPASPRPRRADRWKEDWSE